MEPTKTTPSAGAPGFSYFFTGYSMKRPVSAVAGFALFFIVWHLLTLGNGTGAVPGPVLTFRALIDLADGDILWRFAVASVFRVAWGFGLAALVGIPFGMVLGWVPWLRDICNPVVQALRPASPIAWLPFAAVMFGGYGAISSDYSAIFLIFYAAFFPIVTATISAVVSIDQKYVRSAQNFGVTGVSLFRRVILPAAMPQILTGLRLALGIAWVVIVAAEMLGVEHGLGYLINDSRNAIRFDMIGAAMVTIAVIGLLLDSGMARIESAALARRGMSRR